MTRSRESSEDRSESQGQSQRFTRASCGGGARRGRHCRGGAGSCFNHSRTDYSNGSDSTRVAETPPEGPSLPPP